MRSSGMATDPFGLDEPQLFHARLEPQHPPEQPDADPFFADEVLLDIESSSETAMQQALAKQSR